MKKIIIFLIIILIFFLICPSQIKIYGYINKSGNMIISPDFTNAYKFIDGLAIIIIKSHYGIINKKGEYIVEPQYNKILKFSENLAAIAKKMPLNFIKWGFINKSGKTIISLQFDAVKNFSENLAAVKLNNKWGFINKKGKLIIKLQYDKVMSFSNGIAIVKYKKKYFNINKSGKIIQNLEIEKIISSDNKNLLVKKSGKIFWINRNGQKILDFNNKFKYKNETDKIIQGEYTKINKFINDITIAVFKISYKKIIRYQKFFIKKNGDFLQQPYLKQTIISNQIIKNLNNEIKNSLPHELINSLKKITKKITISCNLGFIDQLDNGLGKIQKEIVIKIDKEIIKTRTFGYINNKGKYESEPRYLWCLPTKENLRGFAKNINKWGFIDKNNNIIIKPKYDNVKSFSEGLAAVRIKKNISLFKYYFRYYFR